MKKGRWWGWLIVLLLVSGVTWGSWRYFRSPRIDPAVESKLASLHEQLSPSAAVKLPPQKRQELVTELHKEIEQLPPEQRELLRERHHEAREKEMEKRVQDFFALPASARTAALDKEIDEMQRQRQAWEQMRAQENRQRSGGNSTSQNGQTDRGQGNRGQGNHANSRPPRSSDHASQIERRVGRLNRSSPEMRAYRALLAERMKQRGITPSQGRPRG